VKCCKENQNDHVFNRKSRAPRHPDDVCRSRRSGRGVVTNACRGRSRVEADAGPNTRPFYPLKELPQTGDLTKIPGRSGRAEGQVINVTGHVLNLAGQPVRDAKVEVWQANSHRRYTHPSDDNPAPLDPNFEGSAILTTDAEGRYRFKTIKPAAYPAGPNRMRPAHIHFQVSGRQDKIVTQMYFEDDPYNSADPFLNSVGGAERQVLLVKKLLAPLPDFEPDSKMVIFDMVLYKG
jgi:protocatechuate 3,4-dioxygenase beta subunit